jgi:hypothetical protein
MNRILVYVVCALALTACTTSVRYSPSEIERFTPEIKEKIKKGEVDFGMSPLMVRYALGPPQAVRFPGVDEKGRFLEIWMYTTLRVYVKKITFADNKVTEIYTGMGERKWLKDEAAPPEQPVLDPSGEEKKD